MPALPRPWLFAPSRPAVPVHLDHDTSWPIGQVRLWARPESLGVMAIAVLHADVDDLLRGLALEVVRWHDLLAQGPVGVPPQRDGAGAEPGQGARQCRHTEGRVGTWRPVSPYRSHV
jgi:hypothetical protein